MSKKRRHPQAKVASAALEKLAPVEAGQEIQAPPHQPLEPAERPAPAPKTNGAGPPNGFVERAAVPIEVKAECVSCAFFQSQDGQSGQCHGGPPTAIVMEVTRNQITGQSTPLTNGFFPPVGKTAWCGSWSTERDPKAFCANCLYFVTQDGVNGSCRGKPPTAVITLNGPQAQPTLEAFFTPVHKDTWCGAWAAKGE